jgi:cobyrinic acid a,c-diamide synthase
MNDERLPDVDALFFGGGFPETNMAALEKNKSMRGEILCFIEKKKPVYAECGGLMYMSRSVTWKGKTCKMVGVIEGDSVMYERPQGRGYVVLKETQDFPWSAESDGDKQIYAHEFHYSRMENLVSPQRFAFSVERGAGVDGSHDGIIYKNLLANYSHLRNVGEYCWVEKFLTFVLRCQRSRNSLEMLSVD